VVGGGGSRHLGLMKRERFEEVVGRSGNGQTRSSEVAHNPLDGFMTALARNIIGPLNSFKHALA
jgi:hypothetical protein